ncbi:hypothetical protein OYE22_16535 [Streptomyces sp. 71268]|uniref:hypothetical protein n=1 Tax=Streptomyces sp. 71268 TaxID=3002640 RepID=UPI0023F79A14|nr:hypothetical protein [Streptomyces sp. 71268]WEV26625.1 hypothetical protein OYE22_16535 [Streptomyces sp. 71268]
MPYLAHPASLAHPPGPAPSPYSAPAPEMALSDAGAIAVGVPLWLAAIGCVGYVFWWALKGVLAFVFVALAGVFGVSLDPERLGANPLRPAVPALVVPVSVALCGLAYGVPAMRTAPGSHQFAVLGALALLAPLATALRVSRRPSAADG